MRRHIHALCYFSNSRGITKYRINFRPSSMISRTGCGSMYVSLSTKISRRTSDILLTAHRSWKSSPTKQYGSTNSSHIVQNLQQQRRNGWAAHHSPSRAPVLLFRPLVSVNAQYSLAGEDHVAKDFVQRVWSESLKAENVWQNMHNSPWFNWA